MICGIVGGGGGVVDIRHKEEGEGRGKGWSIVVTGGQQAWN